MMIATQQETSSGKREKKVLERTGEMGNEYKLLPGKPE